MQRFFSESRNLLRLASPFVAQVAQTAMTLVDTIMAGQVSATDHAAVSVASSFWLPIVLFAQGLIMALTPIVAQLNGAQRRRSPPPFSRLLGRRAGHYSHHVVALFSPLLLHVMAVEPALAAKTTGFLHAILWGIPAYVFISYCAITREVYPIPCRPCLSASSG